MKLYLERHRLACIKKMGQEMQLNTRMIGHLRQLGWLYVITMGLAVFPAHADIQSSTQKTTVTTYKYDDEGNLLNQDTLTTVNEEGAQAEVVTRKYRTLTINEYGFKDLPSWALGRIKCSQTIRQVQNPLTEVNSLNDTVDNHSTTFDFVGAYSDTLASQIDGDLDATNPDGVTLCTPPTTNNITTSYNHDSSGNLSGSHTIVDGMDQLETLTYTPDGRYLKTKKNQYNQIEIYDYYLSRGLLKSKTFINGTVESYEYDDVGRLTKKKNVDGSSHWMAYKDCISTGPEACSNVETSYTISTTHLPDSDGGTEVLSPLYSYYDLLGRQTHTLRYAYTDLTNNLWRRMVTGLVIYDAYGRIKSSYTPYYSDDSLDNYNKNETSIAYDAFDRPIKTVTASNQKVQKTQYINPFTTFATLSACDACSPDSSKAEVVSGLGQQVMAIDSKGFHLRKIYDASGNLRLTYDELGNAITMTYDLAGRKIGMLDPDAGLWGYEYDGFGRLKTQTNPKAQVTKFEYDLLDRLIHRLEVDKDSYWEYDNTAGNARSGQLFNTYTLAGTVKDYSESYDYDSLGRNTVTHTTSLIDPNGTANTTWDSSVSYDSLSRPLLITYPNGQGYNNVYDSYGDLRRIVGLDSKVLWEALTRDGWNRVIKERLGGNLVTTRNYNFAQNTLNNMSTSQTLNGSTQIVQNDSYQFDDYANLLNRTDQMTGYSEDAEYDSLNRVRYLTQKDVNLNQTIQNNQYSYNSIGNILHRTGAGDYAYGIAGQSGCSGPHQVCQTTGGVGQRNRAFVYDVNGNMTSGNDRSAIQWTSFDKVSKLKSSFGVEENFLYDSDHERVRKTQYKDGVLSSVIAYVNPRLDLGGTYERSYDYQSNGTTVSKLEERVHLYADGRTFGQIVTSRNPTTLAAISNNIEYFLSDHLGSIKIVTYETGSVKERMTFDLWGQRVSMSGINSTRHGFTGHEMLSDVDLVNMNGRIYDPEIGRFLSADPNVTEVDDLQSYNRYSYVNNNPLSLWDPSGFTPDTPIFTPAVLTIQIGTIFGNSGNTWVIGGGSQSTITILPTPDPNLVNSANAPSIIHIPQPSVNVVGTSTPNKTTGQTGDNSNSQTTSGGGIVVPKTNNLQLIPMTRHMILMESYRQQQPEWWVPSKGALDVADKLEYLTMFSPPGAIRGGFVKFGGKAIVEKALSFSPKSVWTAARNLFKSKKLRKLKRLQKKQELKELVES